MNRLAQNSIIV